LASPQTVTVTATSVANPDSSASTNITVNPTVNPLVAVSLSPAAAQLFASQSQQFTATLAGTANAAVTWSLAPAIGTIANGLYVAPSTIASQQAVTVTATSAADPTKSASATINLVPVVAVAVAVSPTSASLSGGQSTQFNTTVTGTTNTAVTWSLAPATGTVANGLYTAPASVSAQQTVVLTATSAADPTKMAQASITLMPSQTITMPIEVVGPAGTTESVTVQIPPGTNLSGTKLWMQIHGLRYADKASVQVNSASWVPIDDNTVTLQGLASAFGGIGGGFNTFKMTLNLSPGTLVPGTNTVSFRFNATQGGLGFRVLKFNFLQPDGTMVLPDSLFVQDDPNAWQPPLTSASDIAAGKQLFQTASIIHAGKPTLAHCNNCHTQDGRDLHYFNYSNKFLHYGAVISGLTDQQGDQIASYIRSINFPNPGRPWNPPYQPGPGLDSNPIADWAAGAGIDAVLDNDADSLQYIMPGGSAANLAWNAELNQHNIPIILQFPDWNHWLPTNFPLDDFGAAFTSSPLYTDYLDLRSKLIPNNAASYTAVVSELNDWFSRMQTFGQQVQQPQSSAQWSDATYTQSYHSIQLWSAVRLFELNQEFGLESMTRAAFGATCPLDRAWMTGTIFAVSPNYSRIPRTSTGIGNGLDITFAYDSFIWYQVQLILNDGDGIDNPSWPVDWGYSLAYVTSALPWDGTTNSPRMSPNGPVGTAGLTLEWMAKGLQHQAGNVTNPYNLISIPNQVAIWSGVSASQKVQLMNAWISTWLARYSLYTPAQLFATGIATAAFNPNQPGWFTGDLAWALPQLRYAGVDMTLLNQVVAWATSFWPSHDWAADLNQPCVSNGVEVACK
jgi:hypothetical protein